MLARDARRRGFTLIELMVTTAVMAVLLAAVTSVVLTISRQRGQAGSSVDTRTNGRLALSLISFDLANAGYRFGAPPFAVRVLQNVTGGEAELADTVDCGVAGSGWTVMPGTDVIEIREGLGGVVPGKTALGAGGCAGSCMLTMSGGGSFSNPFPALGDGQDAVVIFSSGKASCAGRLTTAIGVGAVGITMLQQDLRTDAVVGNYPQAGVYACPGQDMSVTALGSVSRYLVCRPPLAAGPRARPALFKQQFGGGGGWVTHAAGNLVQTSFTRVQDNVEDLQVAVMVANESASVTGSTCTAAGPSSVCWCGTTTAAHCNNFVADATAGGLLSGDPAALATERTAYLARAYRVAITTVSDRERGVNDQATFQRPALLDHPAGPRSWGAPATTDGTIRASYEQLVTPQNIVMVQP